MEHQRQVYNKCSVTSPGSPSLICRSAPILFSQSLSSFLVAWCRCLSLSFRFLAMMTLCDLCSLHHPPAAGPRGSSCPRPQVPPHPQVPPRYLPHSYYEPYPSSYPPRRPPRIMGDPNSPSTSSGVEMTSEERTDTMTTVPFTDQEMQQLQAALPVGEK